MPPSSGGLCDGVITIPSESPSVRPRLYERIARETAGVGVQPPSRSIFAATPLPARTSSAVRNAGSDRACVSFPRKSGPSIPAFARCSQTAWTTARMWSSLKESERDDPRCPEVPKDTRCPGSSGSGFPV